ncbi:MAG: thiamine phosphate synthase [Bacteroidia bacterium]|nr:thiamine phosphate synthase [Bacteroidia bacterium]
MKGLWEAMAVTPWDLTELDAWAEKALKRGATALVLRLAHPPSPSELWAWAKRWEGVPWLVHARWTSQLMGWGIHYPAPPLSPGHPPLPGYLYGQSCHTVDEVEKASLWASYVWIGPFFPTPSHPEEKVALLSLDILKQASSLFPSLPLIAIGGIDSDERVAVVKAAGAAGFAAIRYFAQ